MFSKSKLTATDSLQLRLSNFYQTLNNNGTAYEPLVKPQLRPKSSTWARTNAPRLNQFITSKKRD